jgi:hypothetical protein
VVASDGAPDGCGAWIAAPAALIPATPIVPAIAPAATMADVSAINLRMADSLSASRAQLDDIAKPASDLQH